jgi:hypothetical protein
MITGIEEAVQRVRISALTMKGDFVYDRELGTDYSGLRADDSLLCEKLELLLKESCADIHDTAVEVVSCDKNSMVAVLKVIFRDCETTTEVDLSGIIQ